MLLHGYRWRLLFIQASVCNHRVHSILTGSLTLTEKSLACSRVFSLFEKIRFWRWNSADARTAESGIDGSVNVSLPCYTFHNNNNDDYDDDDVSVDDSDATTRSRPSAVLRLDKLIKNGQLFLPHCPPVNASYGWED